MAFGLAVVGAALAGAVVLPVATPATTIRDALGLGAADPPDLDARRAEAVARYVAACIARRGMPYAAIPEPPPPVPDADLDPVAWAERWGFGVSTSVGAAAAAPFADPNAAYAATLAEPERAAYRRALHGDDGTGGCHGRATAAIYGLRDRLLAPLREDLASLERSIDGDPAMEFVRSSWRRCAMSAVRGLGLGLGEADFERRTLPDRLLDVFGARAQSAGANAGALAATRRAERRVAAGIAHCEVAFVAARDQVARRYEARFVRTHAATLARIGRAIRDAEAALPDRLP